MTRIEQFRDHLAGELRESVGGRVVLGSLGRTELPAVQVNWLNQPYTAEGVIVLDAEEPSGVLLVQVDGWIELPDLASTKLHTCRAAKRQADEFRSAVRAAVDSYAAEQLELKRDDWVSASPARRRVSIDVTLERKARMLRSAPLLLEG